MHFGASSHIAYDVLDTSGQMLSLRCESLVYFFLSEKSSFGRQLSNLLSIRMFFSSKSWIIDWTPSLFSISLYTPVINSLEVKDHVSHLGDVFPRYTSREFVGKTGNQISPDQKSDFNKSKFRTRHWCHTCCGLPAGGIPWIALARSWGQTDRLHLPQEVGTPPDLLHKASSLCRM